MIYFIEDDKSIRELVIYTLHSIGYDAKGFSCAKDFWQELAEPLPELILLDIMLPDEDGLQVLKKLRASTMTKKLPILMLSAKGTEFDRVLGLDSGADDYLPKPFGMVELISRIKALIRRTSDDQRKEEKGEYHLGNLYMNVEKHLVTIRNQPIMLTPKEFELLHLFVEHQGIVLTRDRILSSIWDYSFDGGTRTVDVHIRTLRQKLGANSDLIQTIRGVGYRMEQLRDENET